MFGSLAKDPNNSYGALMYEHVMEKKRKHCEIAQFYLQNPKLFLNHYKSLQAALLGSKGMFAVDDWKTAVLSEN